MHKCTKKEGKRLSKTNNKNFKRASYFISKFKVNN